MPEMSIEHEIAETVMKWQSTKARLASKREEEVTVTEETARAKLWGEIKKLENEEIALGNYADELKARRQQS